MTHYIVTQQFVHFFFSHLLCNIMFIILYLLWIWKFLVGKEHMSLPKTFSWKRICGQMDLSNQKCPPIFHSKSLISIQLFNYIFLTERCKFHCMCHELFVFRVQTSQDITFYLFQAFSYCVTFTKNTVVSITDALCAPTLDICMRYLPIYSSCFAWIKIKLLFK